MTGPETPEAGAVFSSRSGLIGYLAVVLAAACWATSGLFVKLFGAETGISALALAFWRDLATFLVLMAGVGLLRPAWLRVGRRDLRWLVAMGASLGVFHVFWNLGVFLNGAAVATVQQAAMPAIVALIAWVVWRESLIWSKILAIVLTFTGTALVSGLDLLGQAQLTLSGLLVGLGIPVTYAAWILFGKKVRESCNTFTLLTYAFGFASLVLLPFQAFTPQPWPIPATAWLWFAGLIGLSTIGGFSIYTFTLERLPASVASILAMTEIAFVTVYAYLLLDERLTFSQILGAVLVVGGVLLLSWQEQRRTRTAHIAMRADPVRSVETDS
jgi:drug/metabolite transporter (DMT)-like permease